MPNKKKFTDEQETAIAQEYRDGAQVGELSKKYEASSWTIDSILSRHNVEKRKGIYKGRAVQRLRPEEISEEIQDTFFFDAQSLEDTGRQKVLKIMRRCRLCSEDFASIVSQVRADIKRGRHPTAYCRECSMTQGGHQSEFGRGKGNEGRKGYLNTHGYWTIYNPKAITATGNGYYLEHREVVAQQLGRALLPDENVHHKNGDRADNSLENLELWTTSQPSGQRVEDKLKWAKEFIALYETVI
jgi:hypothetical protein